MKKVSTAALLIALCLLPDLLMAQNLAKADVISVKMRNSGAIVQNQQVKGYFYFYNLEKKDRKNNNYLLSITDENLREISSVEITRPKYYLLIDAVFNGESFGFLFYDASERSLELMGYDRTLKATGKIIKKLENKYANASYAMIAQGNEPAQPFLVSVPNKGFLYYGITNESKAEYEIEYYDNAMKKNWASFAVKDDFDFEFAAEAFQGQEYVGSTIAKKTGAMSMDVVFDLLVQNIADGKPLFRVPMASAKYNYSIAEVSFDKGKQQFTMLGEYYNKDEKIIKAQSQGFIALVLDMKGKIVSEKVNTWAAVLKTVETKDQASFEKTDILFHEFIKTADGQVFAIGEQYKKSGVPPMSVQLNVYNMVIFQFDADFTIKKTNVFQKDKNVMSLPNGMMMVNSKVLSYIAKAYGGFDYVFSQQPEDKATFMVSYINYSREKGEKGKNVLGTIVYTPEKVFTTDNMALSRKSSTYYVYRAKPGYVMVNEYLEKEKKLDSRLEKINY